MILTWGLEMLASGVTVLFVPLVLVEGDGVLGENTGRLHLPRW